MPRRQPFEDYDPSRFISGVYNYCDRWCERCRFNTRCLVYHEEQQRTAEHLLNDENPNSIDVVMADVTEQFQYSLDMLQKIAHEAGVDLNQVESGEEEPDADWNLFEDEEEPPATITTTTEDLGDRPSRIKKDPLIEQATDLMNRVEKVAERVREDLPAIGQALANQLLRDARRGIEPDGETILAGLRAVRDAYDVLRHYRYFTIIKLSRAVYSLRAADRRSSELAEHSRDDANCTAKLIDECLAKLIDSLWRIGEFRRQWLDETVPLAAAAESLRQSIGDRFPGFQDAIRPGWDAE